MINDRISDMITRIRNAYAANQVTVAMPHTKYLEKVAEVLVEEKYLVKYEVTDKKTAKAVITLTLAYAGNSPAISTIKRVSRPGVRMYSRSKTLRPVLSGLGIAVLSTSSGIMTDRKARKAKIGGEVLFELW
jgi:small subunit ribosomal protein S8